MTTSVARPAHRRQGSDPPLQALGPSTATVTLDGRILENQETQQRGRQQKEDEGRTPVKAQAKPVMTRPPPLAARGPSHDKAPMTPPRVSGISLAPVPIQECQAGSNATDRFPIPGGQQQQQQQQPCQSQQPHGGKLQHRSSVNHLGAKAPPLPPAVVPPCGGAAAPAGAAGGAASGGQQQLIAEGRSIQRNNAPVDPFVAAYLDINGADSDSVCSTPPRLNIHVAVMARGDAARGALGPLTPCPLSPSILTVCAQPGLDDQFVFNGSTELVDMRTCQSPTLPSA